MTVQNIFFAAVDNCPTGSGANCLTKLPQTETSPTTVSSFLGIVFGVIAAVAVLIIVIQGIRFVLSAGDSQKAADARKGVIYAAVGLVVALSAEVVVRVVIGKL